ncbi:MAG: FMN-binding protein [Bacteroidales bacterium]|nr:FMN-binding protein [Bacteroidales bacterium]
MMKHMIAMAVAALFAVGSACAQQPVQQPSHPHEHHHQHDGGHHHGGPHGPHKANVVDTLRYNADGIETTLAAAFPAAKSVKKEGKWTMVYDKDGKLLGYGVYSRPASDGIKGYNGETPVLITLAPKKVIMGVYALPNAETPRFAQRVQEAGFYDSWNGLTIKKAKKKTVDTVSGATFTSRAVAQSVQAALEAL